jgi:hypothetical protein
MTTIVREKEDHKEKLMEKEILRHKACGLSDERGKL